MASRVDSDSENQPETGNIHFFIGSTETVMRPAILFLNKVSCLLWFSGCCLAKVLNRAQSLTSYLCAYRAANTDMQHGADDETLEKTGFDMSKMSRPAGDE